MSQNKLDRWPLIGGAAAAVAASLCCIGPLVLVMLGIGGAWAANLSLLEPYRPLLLGVAVVFLALAWRKIYAASCTPGTLCALPQTNRVYKFLFWLVATLIGLDLLFPYFAPLFY
jgi:mercuric ion transport protein